MASVVSTTTATAAESLRLYPVVLRHRLAVAGRHRLRGGDDQELSRPRLPSRLMAW